MKRPWIIAAIAALAVLLGLSWMLKRSDWLSDRLRLPIEQGLASASGRAVHVGGVGAALSGWIWLHDVSLGPAPVARPVDVSLTAKAVGLKLNLLDLLRGRVSVASLQAVQVDDPTLFLLRREAPAEPDAPTGQGAMKGWQQRLEGLPLPPLAMDMGGGQAWDHLLGHAPRLVAEDVGLKLDPRPEGGLRLSAQGRLPGGGQVELWGRSGPQWQGLEATLRLREVELSRLGLVPAALTITAGRFSGEISAQPRPGAWPEGLGLKGLGRMEGVDVSRLGRPGLEQLRAVWRLQGPQLSLEGLQAQAWEGRVSGEGRLNLAEQSVSATVALKDAQLEGLLRMAGASDQLGLAGRADMNLGVAGLLTAPAFTARLVSPAATWQGHPLTGMDLALTMAEGSVQADGGLHWDGGHGLLSLRVADGALQEVSFKATALPADWLQALVGAPMEGRLDGEAAYRRGADGGVGPWQASLRAPRVRLRGRELAQASLKGNGDGRSARLRLDADLPQWPDLSLQADALRQRDGTWSLRNARLQQKGRSLASAHGTWRPGVSGTAQALALTVKAGPIELAQLPLPSQLRDLQGTVSAEGQLALEGGAWHGSLQAAAPELRRGAAPLPLSFDAQFDAQGLSVTALSLRHGELRASGWAPAIDGPWSGRVALDQASLPALARLAPALPWAVSGTASGQVAFDQAARSLDLALDLADPAPDSLPQAAVHVQARADRGSLDLRSLTVAQGGTQVLSAQASLDDSGQRAWKGEAHWDGLKVGREAAGASGRLRLEGGQGSEGRLVLDPWDVGGKALPAVQMAVSLEQGRLQELRAQVGAAVRATLRRGADGWEARADLDGADPGPLAGLALGHTHETGLRLHGYVEAGPLGLSQAASVRGQLRDEGMLGSRAEWQGHWGEQGLDGKGSFDGWDLERLASALRDMGLDAPALKGSLAGQVSAAAGALTVSAQAQGLEWLDMGFGPGQATLGWAHGRAWVSQLQAGADGPRVELDNASWQPQGAGWALSGDLKAQALSLAIFDVGLDAHADLSQGPTGNGSMRLDAHDLGVGVRHWKGLLLDGDWGHGHWSARAHGLRPPFEAKGAWGKGVFTMAEIKARSGGGRGDLHGTVGPGKALDLAGEAQGMDAADLAGMMGWDQDWHGSAYGTLTVQGDTDHVRTIVNAKLEDGSVGGLPFDLATGLVRQEGDWVDLAPVSPIRLTRKSGVALEVTGKVPLESPTATGLEVRAELKQGGLGLFAGLPGIAAADGPLELSLHFHGRRNDPQVDGQLKVTDGTLTPAWMLPPLDKVQVLAQMEDGRVQIQQARGQVAGDGPLVRLELADPRRPAFVFDHWQPAAFNLRLRASASGLPVRSNKALRFIDGVIYPDLRLGGSWAEPSLEGTVELVKGSGPTDDKALVTWPAVFNPPLADDGGGFADRLRLGLVLLARHDVMVRTEAAQAFVDTGDKGLRVSGPPQARSLEGRLRLTQGSVDYFLASFKLATDHESSIEMRGTDAPLLDLWGVKDVTGAYLYGDSTPRDVQVRLHAYGPLGNVDMRLESDAPDLNQSQLASLTGLGVDASDPRNQGGFARLLGRLPASILTGLARRSGVVDEVGVRLPWVENELAGQATPGPGPGELPASQASQAAQASGTAQSLVEVSVGKYLGENLFLGVNGRVDKRPAQAVTGTDLFPAVGGKVEYRLANNARLSGEYSQDTNGNDESRVMLERSSRFENYNPQKRRWDGASTPGPAPSPVPSPSATATPSPGP